MEMISVESSNLVAVGYNAESAILCIEFKGGAVYEYFDVPQYEYDGLMSAGSHGEYFNQNIRNNYRYNKIR